MAKREGSISICHRNSNDTYANGRTEEYYQREVSIIIYLKGTNGTIPGQEAPLCLKNKQLEQ